MPVYFVCSVTSGRLHSESCSFAGWLDETAVASPNLALMARFAKSMCRACQPVSGDEWRRVRAAVPFHRSRGVRARLARQYPGIRAAAARIVATRAPEVAPRGPVAGRRLRPVQVSTTDPVTARLVEAAAAATREPGATEIARLLVELQAASAYRARYELTEKLWRAVEAWRIAGIRDAVEIARALNAEAA